MVNWTKGLKNQWGLVIKDNGGGGM